MWSFLFLTVPFYWANLTAAKPARCFTSHEGSFAGEFHATAGDFKAAISGVTIAQIAPALIGSTGGELARHPEMGTLTGELHHKMAQTERGIDAALRNAVLVIHNALDDPRSGGSRHFPYVRRIFPPLFSAILF
jgi:hypothetical protein